MYDYYKLNLDKILEKHGTKKDICLLKISDVDENMIIFEKLGKIMTKINWLTDFDISDMHKQNSGLDFMYLHALKYYGYDILNIWNNKLLFAKGQFNELFKNYQNCDLFEDYIKLRAFVFNEPYINFDFEENIINNLQATKQKIFDDFDNHDYYDFLMKQKKIQTKFNMLYLMKLFCVDLKILTNDLLYHILEAEDMHNILDFYYNKLEIPFSKKNFKKLAKIYEKNKKSNPEISNMILNSLVDNKILPKDKSSLLYNHVYITLNIDEQRKKNIKKIIKHKLYLTIEFVIALEAKIFSLRGKIFLSIVILFVIILYFYLFLKYYNIF